jgi:hypothetical protein
VSYRAILQNLKTRHISLREELIKQLVLKDREKKDKPGSLPNHLVRLRQSICINTNTRTG